jgi:DNA-binding transcriptional LysR family regulator
MALSALQHAGVPWRIACASDNLAGIVSATQAGLGVTPLARSLVPATLLVIEADAGLPDIGEVDFILLRGQGATRAPVSELSAAILAKARPY